MAFEDSLRLSAICECKVGRQLDWTKVSSGSDEIGLAPKPPKRDRRAEMEQLARDNSEEDFGFAVAMFKCDQPWLSGDPRHPFVSGDSWLLFVHNFKSYMRRGRAVAQRRAENDRIEKEKMEAWKKEDDVRRYENRWTNHMLVADVPFYDGIPEADRAIIETARAEKDAGTGQRAITDDEDEQDRRLLGGHQRYVQRELEQAKEKRRVRLRQMQIKDLDGRQADRIEDLRKWIDAVKDIATLESCEGKYIGALELDIDTTRYTPMTDEELAEWQAAMDRGEIPF